MRLISRRAREARGLLLAATSAALVATVMVTGLALYNQRAIEAGKDGVLATASAEERSLLVRGSVGTGDTAYAERDAAIRATAGDGLAGVPVAIAGARYGTGRQLTGDLGALTPASGEPVFASVAALPDLPAHADLHAGDWPSPGATPLRVTLPQETAELLGVRVGDRIPLYDRGAERASEVMVAGVWSPRDPRDPYWRLAPGVGGGDAAESRTTYGPLVLDEADFIRTFAGTTSAAWLIEPALNDASAERLAAAGRAVDVVAERLRKEAGLGPSGQVTTRFDQLASRLSRADLVGRSALLTPLLLIVVLGLYTLVLIAALLNEDRRAQTALLRARGAARRQLAGLAAREAALVVLPGAALAPLLANQALRYADDGAILSGLRLEPALTALAWVVAGLVAAGCLLAMLGPALRRGGTYVADLAARSRPSRWAVAQRASIDLALVGLAALAWMQLRQYGAPLAGADNSLGIDPLLAAAPTLGVLAGAVVALRLLPPAARVAERFVDRRPWTTTMLGMWQAGRRPHAGPVLLLALAVGGSTLAWCLVTTWQHSLVAQADHQAGADLRVVEKSGNPPPDRAAQLAALPGVEVALPAWRDDIRLGRQELQTEVIALDAAAAAEVVRLDDDLVDGSTRALFDRLAAARVVAPGADLPVDARRLTGTLRTRTLDGTALSVSTTAIFTTTDGQVYRVPLASSGIDGSPVRFAVDLPETAGRPLRLGGFEVSVSKANARRYAFTAADLRILGADGAGRAVDLGTGGWSIVDGRGDPVRAHSVTGDGIVAEYTEPPAHGIHWSLRQDTRFTAVRDYRAAPVPAVVTPEVLGALSIQVGQTTPLPLPGESIPIVVVGVADALPTTDGTAPALLLDLPSAATRLLHHSGTTRSIPEWWISAEPGQRAATADAAGQLPGTTIVDRRALAAAAGHNPYWLGARNGLLAAALGAVLLALVGVGVDVWATARRRLGELAVLNTLGAAPRLLARALLAEQAFLAGIGVAVGLVVGAGVGAAMAPLVILTPSAVRPVPVPAVALPWGTVGATAATLLLAALVLSALIATTLRKRVAAARLRIGADR